MSLNLVLLGGSGFLGQAVLRQLQAGSGDCQVHCLVHRRPVPAYPFVRVHHGQLESLPADVLPEEPHVVIHCASKQVDHDGTGFGSNLRGIERLLARLTPQTRGIVYVSSFSVYGDGAQVAIDEGSPLRPHTPLARSRAECEQRLLAHASTACPVTILRARFVVGEGDQHFLPGLAALARRRVRIGSGRQRYSLIDVDDYARVILSLARRWQDPDRDPAAPPGEVFNVGYRQPIAFNDIAHALCQQGGHPPACYSLPSGNLLVRALHRLPGYGQKLSERLQLLGFDHYGDVSRLAAALGTTVLERSPQQAVQTAIKALDHADHSHFS